MEKRGEVVSPLRGRKKIQQSINPATSQPQEAQNVKSLSPRAAGEVQGDRGDSPNYGNAHNIFVIPLGSGQVLRGSGRSIITTFRRFVWLVIKCR